MAIGAGGSIGGLWSSFKTGVTKAIGYLSLIPPGTPMAGGVGSVANLAVKGGLIPSPLLDDDSDETFDDADGVVMATAGKVSVASIMSRKVLGVPIVPVAIGLLLFSMFKKGGK